jgi:hypothetical protein
MILRNLTNGERCEVWFTNGTHSIEFYKFKHYQRYKLLLCVDRDEALGMVLAVWGFPSYEISHVGKASVLVKVEKSSF